MIGLKDPLTQQEIPIGAGLLDQIPNSDTYSILTAKKIKTTVRDAVYGASDTDAMDIMLYTGIGGGDDFDGAMKADLRGLGFTICDQNKFVKGQDNKLVYGGFFTQYEHVDGHRITVKRLRMLDHGARADKAPKHPISGLPMTSHDMYFVDMSTYDGVPNLSMVTQKGRSLITGVVQGMSEVPMGFRGNGNSVRNLATDKDESWIHFMAAKGIRLRRNTHCFKLKCNLS